MKVLRLGAVRETEVGTVLPQETRFLETLIEAELAPDRQRTRKQALADAETRMAALLDDQHIVATALEQASEGGTGRTAADDYDIIAVTDRRDLGRFAVVAVHLGSLLNAPPLDQRRPFPPRDGDSRSRRAWYASMYSSERRPRAVASAGNSCAQKRSNGPLRK